LAHLHGAGRITLSDHICHGSVASLLDFLLCGCAVKRLTGELVSRQSDTLAFGWHLRGVCSLFLWAKAKHLGVLRSQPTSLCLSTSEFFRRYLTLLHLLRCKPHGFAQTFAFLTLLHRLSELEAGTKTTGEAFEEICHD
jgi:hypothetical protein